MPRRLKIALCVMPFVPLERPALGVSLLKASVGGEADCVVRYPCHQFADEVGFGFYRRIAQLTPTHHLSGDWVFTRALYGEGARPDAEFEMFANSQAGDFYDPAHLAYLAFVRGRAVDFINRAAQSMAAEEFDVVGFSSTFQQNIASLALARRIKELRPQTVIVFGGANCEGEMGVALAEHFQAIDYVCRGEADHSFPMLIRHLAGTGSAEDFQRIPGLVFRQNGRVMRGLVPPMQVQDMDALPLPDHADFLKSFQRSTAPSYIAPELTAETSRGCWWGAKQHCTFCGLNGNGIVYRSKTPERAIQEVRTLRERYHINRFFFTDNILDLKYFERVFPALGADGAKLQLYYETKANLTRKQLLALRRIGTTWLQPGIENLNSHVLSLMKKGVRGIQNVQILKWAKQFGLMMTWNILCGFPGETEADYDEMIRFMKAVPHLQPPSSFAAFRLDRFSPMHAEPAKFGLTEVRTYPAYALCYPLPETELSRLAYFFSYRGTSPESVIRAINRAWLVCEEWKNVHRDSILSGLPGDDFLLLVDTRPEATATQFLLQGTDRLIYEAADAICTCEGLVATLREHHPGHDWTPELVQAALDEFEKNSLVLREGRQYLSLAVMPAPSGEADWEDEVCSPSALLAPA
jgi:ribosomal peptide maturation radical SAM protein 1